MKTKFDVSDFKKLEVWQKAHALALNAHRRATHMRGNQHAALRSQIMRAATSIPANIVEGREQNTDAAFARFLRIALGSASELEYHLLTARDIGALPPDKHAKLLAQLVRVRRMLHGLLKSLQHPPTALPVVPSSPPSP